MRAWNGYAYHLPPLHYAAGSGDVGEARRLLDEGTPVDEPDANGSRAREFAP